jgi:conjugal transfer ATP-binding protein TraC
VNDCGFIVGVSGRVGTGYALEGVDYLLRSNEAINEFMGELKKMLNHIPEDIVLSVMKRSSKDSFGFQKVVEESIQSDESVAGEIRKSKQRALKSQRVVKKELFLFLSYVAPEKNKKPDIEQSEQIIKNAEEMITTFLLVLGLKLRRLSRMEVLREYFQKLNPILSRNVLADEFFNGEFVTYPRFETWRSQLLLNPPQILEDSIYLDGNYHSVINLRVLPHEAFVGMTESFEEALPDEYEWILTIRKPDQEKEVSRMRMKSNLARANAFLRFAEDQMAEERSAQYQSFLEEMAEHSENIFNISMSVLVKDELPPALHEKKERVLKAFSKLGGAVGVADHFEHELLFLSHLPLQTADNPMSFPVLTDALTRLLPVGAEWTGTEKGSIVLKTHQDEILRLDLFDPSLPAKHSLMIGSTGSGKSFTTNFLLSHFLIASPDHHVVVIDVGGSYRKLARVFGGSYLEIDCSDQYALNPFPEKKRLILGSDNFDSDLLGFLTTLLEKMVSDQSSLTSSDLRILERAILHVYKSIPDDRTPILQDVQNVLKNYYQGDDEDRKRAYHFAKNLGIWTEGRFGKLLNRQGNLSLEDKFLVFDLAKLSAHPELQSILFFVIRSALSKKLDDLSLKKMVVIDEGWRFFNDEIGSRLIEELYRTARKSNGLVLSISQSPEDFLESKASTAILANSYVKYVLKLQKGHELLPRFDLNPNEIQSTSTELEIRPGFFSEMFVKFFNHSVIAKIEPSPLDYWIATTDPDDFLEEEKCRRFHPELSDLEIMKKLAAKCPHGIRKSKGTLDDAP